MSLPFQAGVSSNNTEIAVSTRKLINGAFALCARRGTRDGTSFVGRVARAGYSTSTTSAERTADFWFQQIDYQTKLIKELFKHTVAAVRIDNAIRDWFAFDVGVKQSCILSPVLFTLHLEMAMLMTLKTFNGDFVVVND